MVSISVFRLQTRIRQQWATEGGGLRFCFWPKWITFIKYTTQRYRGTENNKNSVSLCLYVDIDIRAFILNKAQFVTQE